MTRRVWLAWSTGKDSAWALHRLRAQEDIEVTGLVTTFNAAADRVAMHAVRRTLAERQAAAAGLPLVPVALPQPCPNTVYEARMRALLERARAAGVTHMAFGDLYLQEIRAYRERLLAGSGIRPLFPLWCTRTDTAALARDMQAAGVRAVVTCVDPAQVPAALAGRAWDAAFLGALPPGADPCGENGEFHTFCHAAPVFERPIPVTVGARVSRDGFRFADLKPGPTP